MRLAAPLAAVALASCSGPAAPSWTSGATVGDAQATPLSELGNARPDSIVVLEGTVSRVCQARG